jgi:DNA-binding CsgD family transcriptional regulator
MYAGKIEELLELPSQGNPYINFFKGSAEFYLGNDDAAMKDYKEGIRVFKLYNDTIYLASAYNNVGTLHWHANRLDSALIYFQLAKSYTYWHNRMLENNILAIANTLQNYRLSKKQIDIIKQNIGEDLDAYFMTNALNYYIQNDPVRADSLEQLIRSTYTEFKDVPVQLMAIYIENSWITDSVASVLVDWAPNSFIEDALRGLTESELIATAQFTPEVLRQLADNTPSEVDSIVLTVFAQLDSTSRAGLAGALSKLDSKNRLEALQKLKYAAKDFESTIAEKEDEFRSYTIVGIALMFIGLLVIIMSQYRRIQQVKESARLALLNAELAEKNSKMQVEINKVRSGIEDLTETSMQRLKGLRQAVEDLGNDKKQANTMLDDLNIIVTHEEGMMRFRIKNIVDNITAAGLKELESFMNDKEIQVLKLTLLNFRSKEIASLMGVSPQHINNMRSKMKTSIEETLNVEYDTFIMELEKNLLQPE